MGEMKAPLDRKAYTSVSTTTGGEYEGGRLLTAPAHQAPPETNDMIWDDDFFDGDSEVLAVFDFDYVTMEDFYTSTGWAYLLGTMIYPPVFVLAVAGLTPCFLKRNVQWNVRAQHVAITRDGIRFVRDRRKTCWGLPCTDAGRSSKTVPFDKITDCDIEEPAGATCICIKNVLATVNIDTASSGGPQKELRISGLKDPHSFKKLVWAMKRLNAQQIAAVASTGGAAAFPLGSSPVPASIIRDGGDNAGGDGGDAASVAVLLREIRDELRELRKAGQVNGSVGASVTSVVDGIELHEVDKKGE
eukprot:CAMPEP_0197446862 /NCGR_PEP_ID=MMETSP1175-20131217/11688_1 /TAXON_ID=1003142 /ORGANISM="Triceratium dubium, Strain CCMP147" /LENGTH=301 /DNA_ID=CAMNT_0042978027 /DNA_START=117 /DNA_END=1022 /DNA_ORIENTATION=-